MKTEMEFLHELQKHLTGDILFGEGERQSRHLNQIAALVGERLATYEAKEWTDEHYAKCECGKNLTKQYVEKYGGLCGICQAALS